MITVVAIRAGRYSNLAYGIPINLYIKSQKYHDIMKFRNIVWDHDTNANSKKIRKTAKEC